MSRSLRSATLDIDLSALRHNLELVRDLADGRELIASIKANAYGFGAAEIGGALVDAGVRKLWTGNFDEAVEIRQMGIDAEILLFGGAEPQHMPAFLTYDLQPTVFEERSIAAAEQAADAAGKRAPVWVKVDSGLGRLGVPVADALPLIRRIAGSVALDLRGVYTHLPFGTADGKAWALEGYARFQQLLADLADAAIDVPVTQVWGSSGVLAELPDATNAVCVGHALYGLTPLDAGVGPARDFRPLIRSLSAAVVRAEASTSSGGYAGAAVKNPASVAIGLGDGLRKAVAGAAPEIIMNGARVPVTAFTLEHLMIDAGGAAPALFDRATVIGPDITLDDWARWTGSTPLEFMMSLSGRIPASYSE
jgi:alanine racemase